MPELINILLESNDKFYFHLFKSELNSNIGLKKYPVKKIEEHWGKT